VGQWRTDVACVNTSRPFKHIPVVHAGAIFVSDALMSVMNPSRAMVCNSSIIHNVATDGAGPSGYWTNISRVSIACGENCLETTNISTKACPSWQANIGGVYEHATILGNIQQRCTAHYQLI
jgi:hypothetical protein